MGVPTGEASGFALAAALAADGDGARASAGLSAEARDGWLSLPLSLSRLPSRERGRRIAHLTAPTPRPPLRSLWTSSKLHPRALALLSCDVDRSTGQRWLQTGGVPRAGFVPDPALLELLRALLEEDLV